MSLVVIEIERFRKDVQKLSAPKFHEMLQNKKMVERYRLAAVTVKLKIKTISITFLELRADLL